MKKNAVVIIIIAIILILIGVAVYLFVKGSKKGKNLDKDGKIIDPTKDKDGKLLLLEKTPEVTPTPTPEVTPPPTYTAPKLLDCTTDAFPMGMGAKNQCVQRLQQKLNLSYSAKLVDDGKFGKNTNTAVVGLGFVVPLTEADYDKIIAGLPPTNKIIPKPRTKVKVADLLASGITKGNNKPLYAGVSGIHIKNMDGQTTDTTKAGIYAIGIITSAVKVDNSIGKGYRLNFVTSTGLNLYTYSYNNKPNDFYIMI